MTNMDLTKTLYASFFAGFKNKYSSPRTFNYDIDSFDLDPGDVLSITVTITLDNESDVTEAMVKYDGIEDFWRVMEGYAATSMPSWAAAEYEIQTLIFFEDNNLIFYTTIVNETAGTITIPAFTLRFIYNLYDALVES